jgi:putative copper resistance protein D
LFAQWVRSSMQEARREDRRLDRLERLARNGEVAGPSNGQQSGPGDASRATTPSGDTPAGR